MIRSCKDKLFRTILERFKRKTVIIVHPDGFARTDKWHYFCHAEKHKGALAHLVERNIRIVEVGSSSLLCSTRQMTTAVERDAPPLCSFNDLQPYMSSIY